MPPFAIYSTQNFCLAFGYVNPSQFAGLIAGTRNSSLLLPFRKGKLGRKMY